MRNQNKWLSNFFKPEHSQWRREQRSLIDSERIALAQGNNSFIEQEIRDAKAWDEELERRKQHRRASMPQGVLYAEDISSSLLPRGMKDEAKKYDMPERPDAPDEDYLSCFHGQWNGRKHENDLKRDKFLTTHRCSFYFPFTKMGEKTPEACEEDRKESQEKRRFYITTFLIVLGIMATVLFGWLALPQPTETAKSTPSTNALGSSMPSKPNQ